jgi:MOB kinase activator 1
MFRVYGHMYRSHFQILTGLGQESHLNTSFKHFMFFVQEFNLIDKKELIPLDDIIENLEDPKSVEEV